MEAMSLLRRHAFPVLSFAGIALLFFYRAFFLGEVFQYRDLGLFHYPLRHLWVSQLLQGNLPYLNPLLNGGQPLLSNPNYSVFYPGNVLYLLLSFDTAWNVVLAGHVFWAMLGLYFLSRELKCDPRAAFGGALIFGFGGPLLSCMTYYNLLVTGAWMPWVLFLVRRALNEPPRHTGFAMLALSALLLAGEPTILLMTAVLVAAVWLWTAKESRERGAVVRRGLLLFVPPLLIACIQWIPAMLWLPHTSRGEGIDFRLSAAYWSLHPMRWIELFAPGIYGDVMSRYTTDFWGSGLSDSGYPYVLMLYCGWLPWILAPAAWRSKAGRCALGVVACGLLLSLGHRLPGYEILYRLVLPFRVVRYPEKFLILAQFGLAVSASIGFAELLRGGVRKSALIAAAILLAGLAAAALLLAQKDPLHAAAEQHALAQSAALGLLAAGAVWIADTDRWRRRALPALLCLLALDLLPVTFPIAETIPAGQLHQVPTILQQAPELQFSNVLHLGEDQEDAYFSGGMEPDRLMREALHPLAGLNFGVSYGAANDVDRMTWSLSLKRSGAIRRPFPAPAAIERMRQCGISQVLSLRPVQSTALALERDIRFPEGNRLFLYRPAEQPAPQVRWESGGEIPDWKEETPYRIRILNRAGHSGTLVVLRNALPGWTCLLDGKSVSIEEDDQGMIRIPVAAGTQQILLQYSPPGMGIAAAVSVLGLLLAVFVGVIR